MENFAPTGLDLPRREAEKYAPRKFNERHFSILRMLAMNVSVKNVAALCGVTVPVVQYTRDSPAGQDVLESFRAELDLTAVNVSKEIQGLSPIALMTIGDTMLNAPKPEQRLAAAKDIMDRAGFIGKTAHVTNNFITQEDLDKMKKSAFASPPPEMVEDAEIIDDTKSNGAQE